MPRKCIGMISVNIVAAIGAKNPTKNPKIPLIIVKE